MATFLYPTNAELRQVAQVKLPLLTRNDLIFRFFPVRTADASVVSWEQMDNYIGLQQLRGMNGDPQRVKPVGGKRYVMEPGVYGEFARVDEQELTTRRAFGDIAARPVDIADLVTMRQDQLLNREIDRMRYILWTLVVTGTFSVSLPTGGVGATDSYTTQTYAASAWGTPGTGTPIADLRAIQLLGRGTSAAFNGGSLAVMNRVTANKVLANTNAADLGGRRLTGLMPANNINGINELLTGEDLPNIAVYDEGYLDDSGTFQPFIPNNKTVVFGARPGAPALGSYTLTRNANNPNMEPGSYDKVADNGEDSVPRMIDVHRGHNGGPTLEFPGAIVVATNT